MPRWKPPAGLNQKDGEDTVLLWQKLWAAFNSSTHDEWRNLNGDPA
jgi:hypothetical protein